MLCYPSDGCPGRHFYWWEIFNKYQSNAHKYKSGSDTLYHSCIAFKGQSHKKVCEIIIWDVLV
jgi:hypothetical protein